MRKPIFFTLLLVVLAACASNDQSQLSSTSEPSSTTDFDVAILQANEPIIYGDTRTDFHYRIEMRNQTASPVTLKRINLVSLGAATFRLRDTDRTFKQTIAPGTSEIVDFWAPAVIEDLSSSNHMPVTLRIRATVKGANGKDRTEEFVRTVESKYSVPLQQ